MRYEITGGAFPVVICHLQDREQMITERGSMVWMSPNMAMETSGARCFPGPSQERACSRTSTPPGARA